MNFSKCSFGASPRVSALLLGLTASLVCGCGGRDVPTLNETQFVEAVVTSVGDAAGDEAAFKSIFVDGSAPENRAQYFSAAITLVGEAVVDGDNATATVKVAQGNAESEGAEAVKSEEVADGEVTWKLQKVAGEWKLQDAPLPGA
jgi:hypothetical protein